MIRLFLPLFFLPLSSVAQQATGVSFQYAPFADLLEQAEAEDKLIFIDAFTTWCGPCKMMDAQVFPDPEVAAVFNERFVNAKFDMEKGEGLALAERYHVAAYPTYLFVDAKGDLVHKGIGFIPKPALLELADVAESAESLGAMRARYAAGERDPAFVRSYARTLTSTYEQARADTVVATYLAGQDDWGTRPHLQLLTESPGEVGGDRMRYLTEHLPAVADTLGDYVYAIVERALVNDYHRSRQLRRMAEPAQLADYFAEHAGPAAARLRDHYALTYYQRQDSMDEFLPLALAFYEQYPSADYTELNEIAWTFFENSNDPEQLAQAIEWAEASVRLRPYYPNLDTLAWLYHKTGQMEKAKTAARQAIEYAKEASLDYSETAKILE